MEWSGRDIQAHKPTASRATRSKKARLEVVPRGDVDDGEETQVPVVITEEDLFAEGGECRPGALPADHHPNDGRQGKIVPNFPNRTPRSLTQAEQASNVCYALSRPPSQWKQRAIGSFPIRYKYSPKQLCL